MGICPGRRYLCNSRTLQSQLAPSPLPVHRLPLTGGRAYFLGSNHAPNFPKAKRWRWRWRQCTN
jgi:hypothetical protein